MKLINRKYLLKLSREASIGLIYARSDLNHYLLEIIAANQSHYVKNNQDLRVFNSVGEVTVYARRAGCLQQYLCIDSTYDEFGDNPVLDQLYSYIKVIG